MICFGSFRWSAAPKFDFLTFPDGAPLIKIISSWFNHSFFFHALFIQKMELVGALLISSLQLFFSAISFPLQFISPFL